MTSPRIIPSLPLAFLLVATACGSASGADTAALPGAEATTPSAGDRPDPELASSPATASPAPLPPGDPLPGAPASGGNPTPSAPVITPERAVAAKLGLGTSFLIGLGNDAVGTDPNQTHAYALGPKVDLHYMYLSGLGWPEWNAPAGSYVTAHAEAAKARGIVPMFTLYQAAANGEANLAAFNTSAFMTQYWRGVRILFERLGAFDAPAVVHVEPDLWGYAQQKSDVPSAVPMQVGALVPECTDLPADVSGMARCVIRLSRQLAPKVVVGLSASSFGATTNGASDPVRIAGYLKALGADEADIMVVETLDRDAGCFEVGADPHCKRAGSFYWDESNVAHPSFHDHLAWAKTIRDLVGKPLLWWQMPLGVPAGAAGSAGHYRDNRVRYLFAHPEEFAAAGGIGAVFGTGAGNQTDAQTDGGQFKTALTSYRTAPAPLN